MVRLQEPLHSRRSTSEKKRLILSLDILERKDFEKETSVDVFMINKENVRNVWRRWMAIGVSRQWEGK